MGIPPDAIGARIVVYSHEPGKRSTVDATVSVFQGKSHVRRGCKLVMNSTPPRERESCCCLRGFNNSNKIVLSRFAARGQWNSPTTRE